MYWAAAQLQPNRTRLALRLLDLNGYQTYCPRIRERRVIRQRVVDAQRELFVGYCFVLIVQERWYTARGQASVQASCKRERHEKVAARPARMVCKGREQKEASMYYARSERLYSTARWQRIRKYQLMEHPLCKYCAELGLVTPATVCDHVEPHRGDVNKFWCGPFQSLCKPCHDSAKRFVEERGYRPDVGLDGWPLDPNHPANRAR